MYLLTERERGEGAQESKEESDETERVCAYGVHTHTKQLLSLSLPALALSFPFSFHSGRALADTLTSAPAASGLSINRSDRDDTEQLPASLFLGIGQAQWLREDAGCSVAFQWKGAVSL
ncbi:hypothetical protein F7725_018246 [Dissostichus mawsoni]|uniref:Uncharacterized protein n=1 Tax=Dissostichus mawsoni TaxID=36200 RepID=A0A7J5XSK2_DISMA|nr:hypothetical protein F7725_018246 [Dissostichus mawsoni]